MRNNELKTVFWKNALESLLMQAQAPETLGLNGADVVAGRLLRQMRAT